MRHAPLSPLEFVTVVARDDEWRPHPRSRTSERRNKGLSGIDASRDKMLETRLRCSGPDSPARGQCTGQPPSPKTPAGDPNTKCNADFHECQGLAVFETVPVRLANGARRAGEILDATISCCRSRRSRSKLDRHNNRRGPPPSVVTRGAGRDPIAPPDQQVLSAPDDQVAARLARKRGSSLFDTAFLAAPHQGQLVRLIARRPLVRILPAYKSPRSRCAARGGIAHRSSSSSAFASVRSTVSNPSLNQL
jgi:hypothetical protein